MAIAIIGIKAVILKSEAITPANIIIGILYLSLILDVNIHKYTYSFIICTIIDRQYSQKHRYIC